MNAKLPPNGTPATPVRSLRVAGGDVSWAGGTTHGVFAFGNEDGRVWTTDEIGDVHTRFPNPFGSGEAVNGIAFSGKRWMAVSSRNCVSLCQIRDGQIFTSDVWAGAHGIIAAPNGHFFAPLGINGFLTWLPQEGDLQAVSINSTDRPTNIYRIACVRGPNNQDFLVSALRRHGVGRMEFGAQGEMMPSRSSTFGNLDVVDVCQICHRDIESAAAIGLDGTIILYRQVFQVEDPVVIRFPEIEGEIYRIQSVKGHLFVLTTTALYVLAGLIDQALIDNRKVVAVQLGRLQVDDGVDINTVGEKWLLVESTDRVLRFDLDLLHEGPTVSLSHEVSHPGWDSTDVLHQPKQLVGSAIDE